MPPLRTSIGSLSAVVATALLMVSTAQAATWKTNVAYGGSGPTMDLYVPDKVDTSPGIVVALHYCGGSAQAAHGWFESLANTNGFIIIAGDSQNNCWDASPGRSGEKAAVVKMVDYVVTTYHADRTKVFSAGASSGACLTNSLLASYPEIFAGGAVLAGVPAGAWPAGNTSCSGVCMAAAQSKTAMAWGDIVRNASPGFTGTRPRVQLWHGTSDEYLNFNNLGEEVKQWTNALGISDTNFTMESNKPSSGWMRKSYKDTAGVVVLEVNTKMNEVHDLTGKGLWPDVVRFFGLDQDTPGTGTGGAGGGAGGTGGGVAGTSGGTAGRGGTTGTSGAAGTTGGAGTTGTTGSSGTTGSAGTTGTTGSAGTTGTTGSAGTTGTGNTTGGSGTTGTTGSSGTTGGTGTAGVTGGSGATGSAGTTGATGSAGTTGTGNTTGGSGSGGGGGDGGCSLAGSGQAGGAAFLALAALGLVLRARRRK